MVKQIALAVAAAVMIETAQAGVIDVPKPEPTVRLQAILEVGTTSICGMREAPHLIEHLLLSGTPYGKAPLDAILSLRSQGITLSALTRSDFTEITLEGPEAKAQAMSQALVTFLGRSSLPNLGFEHEKRVILSELRASPDFISGPTLYERFIAKHSGGTAPCARDEIKFLDYDFDAVQRAYQEHYVADNISVTALGQPGVFDLERLESEIKAGKASTIANSQTGKREHVESLQIQGRPGLVEIILPIAGRSELPAQAAQAIADQVRLEVQRHIRDEHHLYFARTFVDQSLKGGWLRLEIPNTTEEHIPAIKTVIKSAINNAILTDDYPDPVWQLRGGELKASPVGPAIVISPAHPRVSLWNRLGSWMANLVASFKRLLPNVN